MKTIYWNTNKSLNIAVLIDLIITEKPDLIFLSEIEESLLISNQYNFKHVGYEYQPNPGCDRVKIVKKIKLNLSLGLQNHYFTYVAIPSLSLNIIGIHLPSLLFQHMKALKEFIRDFRSDIDNIIGDSRNERIIVIGDFNVNPFETPMIDYDGFSASNSITSRDFITHLGKSKALYYNPTWKLYVNSDFPGTKYFKRPSGASYDVLEHHFLDQVVISKKLLHEIKSEDIRTLTSTKKYKFKSIGSNITSGSDHLPLAYNIKLI